ncbi:DUF2971 domain-containing protein [Niastella yeongjuensis]|nr:DUF2971 domain-containing protein [Niastella yeongjuensis]
MITDNIEEAIPLKSLHFPKSFFKYRWLTERTIQTIEEGYIWLAEIASLNDPFECSIQFDNDECLRHFYGSDQFRLTFEIMTGQRLTTKEISVLSTSDKPYDEYLKICALRKIAIGINSEEQLKKVQRRWTEIVEEMNRNLRICSFSLNSSSLLLWSHYACEHKGICIEYDLEDVDEIRAFMQPVMYRDRVHKIGLFEEYTTMQMIGASLIKSKDWVYEQEWRLTIFKQKDKFPQKMKVPVPKGIYLGTRFALNSDDLKNKLFKIASAKGIPIFQMEKHPQEFKLVKGNFKI